MIYSILLKTTLQYPENQALVTSKNQSFDYQSLLNKVHQWANYLIRLGVKSGQRVGFKSTNDDQHLFLYLALDCIGGCYVPLDVDLPKLQLDSAKNILNLEFFFDENQFDESSVEIESIIKPDMPFNKSEDITYVMSSSGTTSDRKWIPIQGAGLEYWARVEKDLLNLSPTDKILSTRSPAFDARISEYLRAFAHGASLFLMAHHDRKDMQTLLNLCLKNQITTLLMVPSQLESAAFNQHLPALAKAGLKHLIVTGEACNWTLAILAKQVGIHLWNAYGPTEATFGLSLLDVTTKVHDQLDMRLPVPIAKPISPINYKIIDGKLFVGGFLTPGYIGKENQNSDFLMVEGQRLFDTGDLFSENETDLIYHGRSTFETHCKVGGVKVSPSHVERVIQQYNKATSQAAVVVKDWLGHQKPVAYIQLLGSLDKHDFLNYLKLNLKQQEMPVCMAIQKLPRLSPSDKIDRQQLMAMTLDPNDLLFKEAPETLETNSNLEKMLSIWKELFNLTQLSADQDYFALGGDSITAYQLVGLIKKELMPSYQYRDFISLKSFTPKTMVEQITNMKVMANKHAVATPLILDVNSTKTVMMLPPLLGEGCFTYKHLAARYAEAFKVSIYGISSPALFEDGLLPTTIEEEAEQCVEAIKHVQPIGPYRLFGFSYGATLAWQVANSLLKKGDKVSSLELMDGFPPIVLQKMPERAHARLLFSLIQFIINVLTKKPYNEQVKMPISVDREQFEKRLPELSRNQIGLNEKQQHIHYVFSELSEMVISAEAKRLVLLAKQHLLFMLSQPEPNKLLPITPIVFQTNETQDYWKMMDTIKGLIIRAPSRRSLFWNRYFSSLRRNGVKLDSGHLELLFNQRPTPGKTVENFWQKKDDPFSTLSVGYRPTSFYCCELIEDKYIYNLHFFRRNSEESMNSALIEMNVRYKCLRYDALTNLDMQNDSIHDALISYQVTVLPQQKKEMDDWLTSIKCSEKRSSPIKAKSLFFKTTSNLIYLTYISHGKPLFDCSFELASKLEHAIKVPERYRLIETPDDSNIIYGAFSNDQMGGTFFDALRNYSEYLAQFISLINTHINQDEPVLTQRKIG